ncbi:MAG: sucrose synthase [Pseudomonadota bacterium]
MRVVDSRTWCDQSADVLHAFLEHLAQVRDGILWRGEIEDAFKRFLHTYDHSQRRLIKGTMGQKISHVQEAVVGEKQIYFLLRPIAGIREAISISRHDDRINSVDIEHYLAARETAATGSPSSEEFSFSIDFSPFRIFHPDKPDPTLIGKGLDRLAHIFISKIHENPHWALSKLLEFLSFRNHEGEPLLFSRPMDLVSLNRAVERALDLTRLYRDPQAKAELLSELNLLGLAKGWGDTAERMEETFTLLAHVLHDPKDEDVRKLLCRLPLIQKVLLITIHGWFAQEGVLGRPDTGGQVVYALNQARALERHLKNLWKAAGVDANPKIIILSRLIPESDGTSVNVSREPIYGTDNSFIMRVPFKNEDGEVVPHWISRFKVWPYLNRFTKDSYYQLMTEYEGLPDLIIGNYSDGNFVATALGREWGVITGVIAHALEKNKYLFSDVRWKEMDKDYHFSVHYLNDMLSSNSADFIITSTYQEIAGTHEESGQYESYGVFTLPQNYRVQSGIDIYTPQFVINPPGYDDSICFPYDLKDRRDVALVKEVENMCFGSDGVEGAVGCLEDPNKSPIFSMARLDKIKNIAGLVKIFAQSDELRERANLIIVGGVTSEKQSSDLEEQHQIRAIHQLIKRHNLNRQIRWLPGETNSARAAEFYRVMADREGVFVQPALYEAFGLTVIESMACGLPVIATRYGGPSESIQDGVTGLLIDPRKSASVTRAIMRLISPDGGTATKLWHRMSEDGMRRARDVFSWDRHVGKAVEAAGLYGFWDRLFSRSRAVQLNYVDAIHYLLLLPRIKESA